MQVCIFTKSSSKTQTNNLTLNRRKKKKNKFSQFTHNEKSWETYEQQAEAKAWEAQKLRKAQGSEMPLLKSWCHSTGMKWNQFLELLLNSSTKFCQRLGILRLPRPSVLALIELWLSPLFQFRVSSLTVLAYPLVCAERKRGKWALVEGKGVKEIGVDNVPGFSFWVFITLTPLVW